MLYNLQDGGFWLLSKIPDYYVLPQVAEENMWTIVYMAADVNLINYVIAMLKENNIITKARRLEKTNEEEHSYYEILVPAAEVSEAQELIIEMEIS